MEFSVIRLIWFMFWWMFTFIPRDDVWIWFDFPLDCLVCLLVCYVIVICFAIETLFVWFVLLCWFVCFACFVGLRNWFSVMFALFAVCFVLVFEVDCCWYALVVCNLFNSIGFSYSFLVWISTISWCEMIDF